MPVAFFLRTTATTLCEQLDLRRRAALSLSLLTIGLTLEPPRMDIVVTRPNAPSVSPSVFERIIIVFRRTVAFQ